MKGESFLAIREADPDYDFRQENKYRQTSAVLTEAQEYGVNGHVIDVKEQDSNSISKNH